MKKLELQLAAFLSICLLGCSGYQYYAIQNTNVSFNKFATFAWLPASDSAGYYSDIVDEKIKDEVTAGLEKRGLSLRIVRPDLLIRYIIQVRDQVRYYNRPAYVYAPGIVYHGVARNRYGRHFYYSYTDPYPVYVGGDIEQVSYKQGTLIIDLIERRSHKVIWRGCGTGEINNPERAVRDIPEIVEGILNKIPISPVLGSRNK